MTAAPATPDVTLADLAVKLDALLHSTAAPARWQSIEAAAKYADLSTKSIRRLIASGKLVAHRPVKGKILVDRHQLDQLIIESTTPVRKGRGLTRSSRRLGNE